MLVLQNAYRTVFLLLLLTCAPSFAYSYNCPQSFGYTNASNKNIENLINKRCKKHKKLSVVLNM